MNLGSILLLFDNFFEVFFWISSQQTGASSSASDEISCRDHTSWISKEEAVWEETPQ